MSIDATRSSVLPTFEPIPNWSECERSVLLDRIEAGNLIGMGGAGYPTALKIGKVLTADQPRIVLANGVECEIEVSADATLLAHYPLEVLTGIEIAAYLVGAETKHLICSDAKLVRRLEAEVGNNVQISLTRASPSSGYERTLIKEFCGVKLPTHQYPADVGILVLNVATLFAMYELVEKGVLPAQRIATVNGEDQWVTIGSSCSEVLGTTDEVRVGGPTTGTLRPANTPIEATLNALSFEPSNDDACIHCGLCTDVCPLELPVEAMLSHIADGNLVPTEYKSAYAECFECGACVATCPSQINILDALRMGRATTQRLHEQKVREHDAKERNDRHIRREGRRRAADDRTRQSRLNHTRNW